MPKINQESVDKVLFFFSKLKHTKGRWRGTPFKLLDWQINDILIPLFGTLDKNGKRIINTVYVEIPKKSGKSEFGAGLALYLLIADGEGSAEIYSAASDKEQASIVSNIAIDMSEMSPQILKRVKIVKSQKRIVHFKSGSYYRVLSAEAFSKHGYNPHGIIFDELHVQPNRELWDVLTTASTDAREQPVIFAMTTAGFDKNSICYEIHDYALKVKNKVIDDPTFLPVIYAAADDADWTSKKVWKMCNPSIGDILDIKTIERLCKKAQETPALENTFRRLRLNQWTQQDVRWLPIAAWDKCAGIIDELKLKGKECYGGLDLASSIDIAALSLIFPMENKEHIILPFFWIPEDTMIEKSKKDRVPYDLWVKQGFMKATPGNVIDYAFIYDDIVNKISLDYDILELSYDRWGMTQLSQQLIEEGMTVIPMGQGFASMSAPTKELMRLILMGAINHGNNPVLRWMADNVVVKEDPAGNLKPDRSKLKKTAKKIDGIVATIMALDRVIRNQEGDSVYDTRGIDVI